MRKGKFPVDELGARRERNRRAAHEAERELEQAFALAVALDGIEAAAAELNRLRRDRPRASKAIERAAHRLAQAALAFARARGAADLDYRFVLRQCSTGEVLDLVDDGDGGDER